MPLFEIHVSVDLKDGLTELKWIAWCTENNYHYIRVLNTTGKNNIQNMIGLYVDCENKEKAIIQAEKIGKDIGLKFHVLRVKVESVGNSKITDDIDKKSGNYWEYHIKVKNKTISDLTYLQDILQKIHKEPDCSIGLSFSVYGKSQAPIITLRSYSGTKDKSEIFLNNVINVLEENSIKRKDMTIQYELAFYDTNITLDEGWKL